VKFFLYYKIRANDVFQCVDIIVCVCFLHLKNSKYTCIFYILFKKVLDIFEYEIVEIEHFPFSNLYSDPMH